MNGIGKTPSPTELTLRAAQLVLRGALEKPWLASWVLRSRDWLSRLAAWAHGLGRLERRLLGKAVKVGTATAFLLSVFGQAPPAQAATIVVSGSCTLADAISSANSDTAVGECDEGYGADTISLTEDVVLTDALPAIESDITIEGNGKTISRDSSADLFGILHVTTDGNLTLKNATITGGEALNGGGILNEGTVTIQNSTINGNTAYYGGGIFNLYRTPKMKNSTISGNTDNDNGGGILTDALGALTIQNSTISDNTADYGGGILNLDGALTIQNSTISGNTADYGGGGILNYASGTVTIQNSIVAQNSAGDCVGSITSQGYNVESGTSCGFTATGDQQNVSSGDLNLGALADNGGPTQTRALGTGSVAIDQIPIGAEGCSSAVDERVDQRGAVRADGANRGGSACDVGAYEANSNQTPTVVRLIQMTASRAGGGGQAPLIGAVLLGLASAWFGLRRRLPWTR